MGGGDSVVWESTGSALSVRRNSMDLSQLGPITGPYLLIYQLFKVSITAFEAVFVCWVPQILQSIKGGLFSF